MDPEKSKIVKSVGVWGPFYVCCESHVPQVQGFVIFDNHGAPYMLNVTGDMVWVSNYTGPIVANNHSQEVRNIVRVIIDALNTRGRFAVTFHM